jgi:pilus assembly protein CpaB
MKFPFKKININKSTALLGVAIAIGLLAALGARSYLSNRMDAIEARSKSNLINVVVAKGKLQKGDVISSETVAVRSVPAEYAHSNALMPNQFDTFDGKALAYGINAGEIIIWSMLETQKTPTFSARVEAGRRAITVPVDEINSISGLLEPGDLVDLMLTVSQEEKKYTFPVLQAVKVMATGQRSVDDPKSGERRQYSTVTLDATLEQAQNVIAAREAGKITALLRNPSDVQEVLGASKTLASVLGLGGASRISGSYGSREVPVLYGGKGGKLPAEGMQLNATSRRVSGTPFPALTSEIQQTKSDTETGGAASAQP